MVGILSAGLFILIILLVALFKHLKSIERKKLEEIMNKFKDKKIIAIDSKANFFGAETEGVTQIRGNGVLILTDEELYFEMWAPKKTLSIPLKSITKVETPRSFLKKSKLFKLLKITFKDDNEGENSAAWFVEGLDNWKSTIENLINK